ncbi:MAG: hypothetical protein V4502_00510 [Pseudomonadota bacterium]
MNLSSEQVHWIFGGILLAVTGTLILRDVGGLRARWVDYLLPALLAAFGIEMLLDPLVHGAAAPANYGPETAQHFILGLLLIAVAGAEGTRTWRGATGLAWRLPLAAALAIAAAAFWFHAQHDSSAPMILLITQHRMIATILAVSAAAALADPLAGGQRRQPPALAYLALLLALQLLVYTEGGSLFGTTWSQPMQMGASG